VPALQTRKALYFFEGGGGGGGGLGERTGGAGERGGTRLGTHTLGPLWPGPGSFGIAASRS
jgi:hypothetical protein